VDGHLRRSPAPAARRRRACGGRLTTG
jgi:hypothetical protein